VCSYVKCLLPSFDFNQNRNRSTYYGENGQIPNLGKNRQLGLALVHAHRRTEGHDKDNSPFLQELYKSVRWNQRDALFIQFIKN
jgi:hypothetical protein